MSDAAAAATVPKSDAEKDAMALKREQVMKEVARRKQIQETEKEIDPLALVSSLLSAAY